MFTKIKPNYLKLVFKIILVFLLILSIYPSVFAGTFNDIFNFGGAKNPYGNQGYNLERGISEVKNTVSSIETNRTFSEYIQAVVVYLLGFVSLIAVIYMIYGGFIMMTSTGDEEKVKKTKNIIIYVILGMMVMWLAYSIVLWVLNIFKNA